MDVNLSRWSLRALFHFKAKIRHQPVRKHHIGNPYHAVSIAPGVGACDAVLALGDKRFLSREAPRLPLPGCGTANCACRYQHHEDRRRSPRRATDTGQAAPIWRGRERRASAGGRRFDDG